MASLEMYNVLDKLRELDSKKTEAVADALDNTEKMNGEQNIAEAKPDFLDLDKDGNKKEPMKKAAKDAKKKTNEGRLGFKDLEKLGAANASKVDQEARRQGSADMEPGDADELRYRIAKKMGLVESVITEGEVENAELVLAAKDMVDRVQGMLEDIGKMINEDLPPLT